VGKKKRATAFTAGHSATRKKTNKSENKARAKDVRGEEKEKATTFTAGYRATKTKNNRSEMRQGQRVLSD
jgi:hypothetical protein